MGNAVLALCPRWLLLVEGVGGDPGATGLPRGANGNLFWGEQLGGAKRSPVRLTNPRKLAYSPHVYGPGFPSRMPYYDTVRSQYDKRATIDHELGSRWEQHFGFLSPTSPILIGEIGGKFDTAEDRSWQEWAISYAARRGFGVYYFCLNPNSHDTYARPRPLSELTDY